MSRIERKAPRISQSIRVDFWTLAICSADKRIVAGNAVLPGGAVSSERVDTVNLSVPFGEVLRVAQRICRTGRAAASVAGVVIVGTAAIAHAEIEHAVGTELESAAVVIELRLVE